MKTECQKIQDYLEVIIPDDLNMIVERGNELTVYIARTGKMLADAKNVLNEKMQSEVINTLKK